MALRGTYPKKTPFVRNSTEDEAQEAQLTFSPSFRNPTQLQKRFTTQRFPSATFPSAPLVTQRQAVSTRWKTLLIAISQKAKAAYGERNLGFRGCETSEKFRDCASLRKIAKRRGAFAKRRKAAQEFLNCFLTQSAGRNLERRPYYIAFFRFSKNSSAVGLQKGGGI